ncbi:DciA family protein [Kitasatospora sp. NPDC090091]|uniref:DciA family protein n=1 Tax=Kitasatospora sp. NPDC090091 TaxID=3364081 RepID=UPI003810582D
MTDPQTTGADIARQALAAARAAAKTRKAEAPKPQRRRLQNTRITSGREPVSLAGAISALLERSGLDLNAAGGDLLADWPTIAPELADVVAAERFDPATAVLHLRPASPAYATQLRLLERQIVGRINHKLGRDLVCALRVLPPGALHGTPRTGPEAPAGSRTEHAAAGPDRGPHAAAAQALAEWRSHRAQSRAVEDAEQVRRIATVRARLRPYGPDLRESETDPGWTRVRDRDVLAEAQPSRGDALRESEDAPAWQAVREQQAIDPADSLRRHQAAAAVAHAHRSRPQAGDPALLFHTRVA